MSKPEIEVKKIFDEYAVMIDGDVVLFDTEEEAVTAGAVHANGAANLEIATRFAKKYKGLADKNAKGKINIITEFLTWVDSGTPDPVIEGEDTAEVETTVTTEEDDEEVTF